MDAKKSSSEKSVVKNRNTSMMKKHLSEFILDNTYVPVFIVLVIYVMIRAFYSVITYELSHAYTADAPLYWAVGRGMLNGLTPYSEMYENKPIGVFFLSALSFRLTDSTILCNWISILAIVIIVLVPGINIFSRFKNDLLSYGKDNKKSCIYGLFCFLTVLFSSTMLAIYVEDRSGAFQVEALGTACSLLYINSARRIISAQSKKKKIARTLLTALYISLTVMLKEPF